MDEIKLNIRTTYIKILLFFIFIMYPLRLLILWDDNTLYSLRKHFFVPYKYFNFEQIPYLFISLGILFLFIIAFFFPREIIVKNKIPFSGCFKFYFIIQNVGLAITYTLFNLKWGSAIGDEAKILIVILESILGKEFIFFIVLYNEKIQNKSIGWIVLLYSIPFFLGGSKSGIIVAVLYIITLKLALKEKIFSIKKILVGMILYITYPLVYYISWMVRDGRVQKISFGEIDIYKPLKLISHRVNGIDIFMGNYEKILNLDLMNTYENIMYFFKGIFGNGIISLFTQNKKGYGRIFAEQVFYQPPDLINAYESTLIGTIYYSKNRIILGITIIFIIICIIKIICKLSSRQKQGFLLLYFLIQLIMTIMTGLIIKIGLTLRFFFIYFIIIIFLKQIKRISKKKEKNN